jgi:hypothetical protein
MLIAVGVALWFVCGLLAIHLAFAAARSQGDVFDAIHVWLALLGPVSLVLAWFTFTDGSRDKALTVSR